MPTFRQNLGIADDELARELEPLLLAFIVHHHLNIDWYERRLAKERWKHKGFFVASLLLLLLIPVLTFVISDHARPGDGSTLAVQLTAVLTGIIGVHNALRSLFEKRNVIALFHKAAASLKRAVYDFEDRWSGCVPSVRGEELELFKGNVRDHIRRAREVEAEEREAYFAAQAGFPLIDIGSAISDAGAAATRIVGLHSVRRPTANRSVAAPDALENAKTRVDVLRAKLALLTATASRATKARDKEQKRLAEQSLAVTREELQDAEQALLALSVRQFDDLR